jgi:hypothetical protein
MSTLLTIEPSLRPALFDLLVRVARVDPMIGAQQIAAVRGAQIALGLVEIPALDGAVLRGATGEWHALVDASDRERSLAYAAARWVALADGVLDDAEVKVLDELRLELGLGDAAVKLAESIANHVTWLARAESLPPHRAFSLIAIEAAKHAANRRRLRAA